MKYEKYEKERFVEKQGCISIPFVVVADYRNHWQAKSYERDTSRESI